MEGFRAEPYFDQRIEAYVVPINGRAEAIIQNAGIEEKEVAYRLYKALTTLSKLQELLPEIEALVEAGEIHKGDCLEYITSNNINRTRFMIDSLGEMSGEVSNALPALKQIVEILKGESE